MPTDVDTYLVTELPEEEDFWKSFYVWEMKATSETEYEAIIISPEQWEILAAEGEASGTASQCLSQSDRSLHPQR